MAEQWLKELAHEGGAYGVQVSFDDETETPVVPSTVVWTLTDLAGNVVNGRDSVSMTPASSVRIVLSGDDLAVVGAGKKAARALTVSGTYNDPDAGATPFVFEYRFYVCNLAAV